MIWWGCFIGLLNRTAAHTPAEWIKALDGQLTDMVTCGVSRLHVYPAKILGCPWCEFQSKRGILYFLDDNHFKATAALGVDRAICERVQY
jgi:DNA-binding helix-hairpin-helix protein with protein kinase domain